MREFKHEDTIDKDKITAKVSLKNMGFDVSPVTSFLKFHELFSQQI
jgi:hypothetical protein